jgi:long-chain acyl-CoA synthetase
VLSRPFSTENGLLTPTLKVKRHRIFQEFAAEIERAYADALPAPLPESTAISPPTASPA